MIPTLPSAFNFLGFQSQNDRPLTSEEKRVRSLLFNFDEEKAFDAIRAKFEPLKKIYHKSSPAHLQALPDTGGWHRLCNGIATPEEPNGEWLVFDCETSQFSPGQWNPLCAVASNGRDRWIWLPNVSGEGTEETIPFDIPFIAHNSAYDTSMITGNPGSICTMAMASQLYAAPDYMLNTMKVNRFVPWANCALPAYVSLDTLARFLKVPMHSKDTRNLCRDNTWYVNYRDHLLEIVNYCLDDVAVTVEVFAKMLPDYLKSDPNPLAWLGLFEISKFKLPFEPDFPKWLQKVDETVYTEANDWEAKILERLHDVKREELQILQESEAATPKPFDLSALAFLAARTSRKASPRVKQLTTKRTAKSSAAMLKKFLTGLKAMHGQAVTELEHFIGSKIRCRNYLDGKVMAPEWLFDFEPTPTNKSLPTLLGVRWNGELVEYDHPHFNILDLDGKPVGTWWSSKMELEKLSCAGFDVQGYGEFSRNSNPWRVLRDRLGKIKTVRSQDRLWFTPQIHKSGTVSCRLTDNILHVAPKLSKNVPGTELLGKIKAPAGYVFVYFDYTGQETRIFQALCDQGILGSSGYGKTVLTGDMHTVVRGLIGFSADDKGRKKSKPYTFFLQYGGGENGCETRLILEGFDPPTAKQMAKSLVTGYKGEKTYSKGKPWYKGGIASEGYNALERMKGQEVMRTLLFHRAQSLPMTRQKRGYEGGMTLGNWPIQGTGSDFLRGTFAMVELLRGDLEIHPICSIHDMVCFLAPVDQVPQAISVLNAAHLYLYSKLYSGMSYKELPHVCAFPDSIEVDSRLRLTHLDPYVTPSNPDGFPVDSCAI
jgi:DNA polymerase family A